MRSAPRELPVPAPRVEWLVEGGVTGAVIRARDWSGTPLGPRGNWPSAMRAIVNLVLASPMPTALAWGRHPVVLYNDAFAASLGAQHPDALGRSPAEVWASGPVEPSIVAAVIATGEAVDRDDPRAAPEVTVRYSPVRDDDGALVGAMIVLVETTLGGRERTRLEAERRGARAEELVRASEARLRLALDAAQMVAWEYDPATLAVTLTDNAERVLGLPRLHAISDEGFGLIHPDDVGAHREKVRQAIATGGSYVSVYRHAHGAEDLWLEEQGRAVVDASGKTTRLVGVVQNITERRASEEALRVSEERFRSVVESMSEGLMMFDAAANLTYQNPASLRIHGFAPEGEGRIEHDALPATWNAWDATGRPISFDEWPVSRVFRRERFQNQVLHVERVETGQAFDASYNGCPIFDAHGHIALGFITIRDITEQRRAEAIVRDSELRFRRLADAMPQVVWTATPDGCVDYYNERVHELSGVTRNDDGTWSWHAVLHPDDVAPTAEAWTRAIHDGVPYDITHRVKRVDGSFHWYLSRGVPVRDGAGRVVKWFGTATNIHAQKEAEESLREADQHKNEFLAMLSHELRNPLAPIRNSVYILERAAPGGEQAKRAMAVIDRQVTHMARLVDELLDVTRISRGKIRLQREWLPLDELVRATADDFRELFERQGITFDVHVQDAPLHARVDRTRIAQVVGNLLSNAAKFTPLGGHVTLSLTRAGDEAVIEVRDDGAGIEPHVLGRLFEPFVQADATLDRSKGGLGLGLALVKGLAELHGGHVSARSAGPGAGAELRVTLPLELEPETHAR